MKVEITTMPELRVAALRHRGAYNCIGKAFERLGHLAGPAGLFGPKSTMIAIYHDDPRTTPEADLRSDAGCTIAPGTAVPEGLAEHTIPAGKYAKARHKGPYSTLPETWAKLSREWLPASGQRRRPGVSYELYDHPTPDPADLITDIYIPLG